MTFSSSPRKKLKKIAADAFPRLRLLATGSSTLAATRKFSDSLTGRKRSVHLVPVMAEELEAFGCRDLLKRLLVGGLPEALLRDDPDPGYYSEWIDSYFARDIAELFRVEKRDGFLRLLQMLLRQSGGLFEATRTAAACGLSRPTVLAYVDALEVTGVCRVLRPFHGGGIRELVRRPKVYGFDTGFVCHARGWDRLRPEDRGILWEHLVLETLQTLDALRGVQFWRDKLGHEVDFVLPASRDRVDTVEAKWSSDAMQTRGLTAFRRLHPRGRDFVVSPDVPAPQTRQVEGRPLTFVALKDLRRVLRRSGRGGAEI